MVKNKNIVVVSPNSLVCIGLKSILRDFFFFESILIYPGFEEFMESEAENTPDLIFLPPDVYVVHDYFQGIKNKVVVMLDKKDFSFTNQPTLSFLDISLPQSEIIDHLNRIFTAKTNNKKGESSEGLSIREIEVLKLVAKGMMNKQIADLLSISLHTVISHRKNITRKLGINTVSGLTVYALINGLIHSEELENENI